MADKVSKKYTSTEAREIARNMAENNFTQAAIAKAIDCSDRTVRNILARFEERGNDENKPKGRPPKIIDGKCLRRLERDLKQNPRQTLGEITENINNGLLPSGSSVSQVTVRRAIHNDLMMSNCHARIKPHLQTRHILLRQAWATHLQNWSNSDWSKVIWTDEMSFEVGKNYCMVLVWRRPGQEYDPLYIAPSFKSGRSSIMVWGAIAHRIKGPLVRMPKGYRTAQHYIDIVMAGPLQQFYQAVKGAQGAAYVVEDGASVHTAKVTQKWCTEHQIQALSHPAQSPDLNPIENVWSLLKYKVNKRYPRPKTIFEAENALFEEWEKIDQIYINKLIESMPNRVKDVIKNNGHSTRF